MPHVDFKHVRDLVQIEAAAQWLGLAIKKHGAQYRCPCPLHDGGDRALVITPAKNVFYCFAPECRAGGDVIELTAKVRQISTREAALALQAYFLDPQAKIGSAANPLAKIDYLEPEHALVQAIGVPKDVAEHLGIGYAPKGTMAKRVLFPIRDSNGKLVGYIGVNPQLDPPVKLPSRLHL